MSFYDQAKHFLIENAGMGDTPLTHGLASLVAGGMVRTICCAIFEIVAPFRYHFSHKLCRSSFTHVSMRFIS